MVQFVRVKNPCLPIPFSMCIIIASNKSPWGCVIDRLNGSCHTFRVKLHLWTCPPPPSFAVSHFISHILQPQFQNSAQQIYLQKALVKDRLLFLYSWLDWSLCCLSWPASPLGTNGWSFQSHQCGTLCSNQSCTTTFMGRKARRSGYLVALLIGKSMVRQFFWTRRCLPNAASGSVLKCGARMGAVHFG